MSISANISLDEFYNQNKQPTSREFDAWFTGTLGCKWSDAYLGDFHYMYIKKQIINKPICSCQFKLHKELLELVAQALPKYKILFETESFIDDELRILKGRIVAIKNDLFFESSIHQETCDNSNYF